MRKKNNKIRQKSDYCLKRNAVNRYDFLQNQIAVINERLANLPEGKLLYHRTGNTYQFHQRFISGDAKTGNRRYINKRNVSLAKELAEKEYLEALLRDYERESRALNMFIKHAYSNNCAVDLLARSPVIAQLMEPAVSPLSEELKEWQNAEYETKEGYEDSLTINGPGGIKLRSKSELVIAMELSNRGIPYRYEGKLVLGDFVFFPDFTIRHPDTGKEYIWEHFGMMDIPAYVRNMESKMQVYLMNGYIPSINFIATYETGDKVLDLAYVEALINYYFGEV